MHIETCPVWDKRSTFAIGHQKTMNSIIVFTQTTAHAGNLALANFAKNRHVRVATATAILTGVFSIRYRRKTVRSHDVASTQPVFKCSFKWVGIDKTKNVCYSTFNSHKSH